MSAISFQAALADEETSAAETFFDLANAERVRFTVPGGREVTIRQDPANQTTGGCIWETSYLLALHALRELTPRLHATAPKVRCLEVGAGCGLLGCALAAAGAEVVSTELESAMPNLEHNVACNATATGQCGSCTALPLRWGDEAHIAAVRACGPYTHLLGTDVVYVEAMVTPLLQTLWSLSAISSTCWLCGQVRCPDAHAALLREAPGWFADVQMIPLDGLGRMTDVAHELECFLLQCSSPRPKPPAIPMTGRMASPVRDSLGPATTHLVNEPTAPCHSAQSSAAAERASAAGYDAGGPTSKRRHGYSPSQPGVQKAARKAAKRALLEDKWRGITARPPN